ncbi:hypothetical protein D3C72_1653190 [compost metagenome]
MKPVGVFTSWVALLSTQPSVSPLMFNGKVTSAVNLPASSSTALMVSTSTSAWGGMALNSSLTLSTSCMTNCMSRRGGV